MAFTDAGKMVLIHPTNRVFELVSIKALHDSLESYLALFSSTVICERFEHPQKATASILPTDDGIEISVNPQYEKVPCSIVFNMLGKTMVFNDLHLLKAYEPIFFTEEGMLRSVMLEHKLNAPDPIMVNDSGSEIFSTLFSPSNKLFPMEVIPSPTMTW